MVERSLSMRERPVCAISLQDKWKKAEAVYTQRTGGLPNDSQKVAAAATTLSLERRCHCCITGRSISPEKVMSSL
ncbi:hypothetical protein Tco_0896684 [Tanacetum coccineum]